MVERGRGRQVVGGRLYFPTGVFRVTMGPKSASHRLRQAARGSKKHLANAGVNIRHMPPI